ncbi:MAG: Xaa-Pro peptidase family protein [Deltaproteobacteria bacterium]|nr:Xaa-Pro peptidase family protein [Deltaproteobacteria bacterium]
MKQASLIIASSETDSNLYYACRFLVPDPVIYFEIAGRKHLVLSDLELDRARLQAKVHHFHSLHAVASKIKKRKNRGSFPTYALIVDEIFKSKGIRQIIIPGNFPSQYFAALKKLGYQLEIKPDPFYEARLVKSQEEKKWVRQSLAQVETALGDAVKLLQKSKIKGRHVYYGKEKVTSEILKGVINTRLMELGCVANHTIVASGAQGSFPHHEGSGPILAHTPIIFDIFPRHSRTLYWGDMTRTMVKGKPTPYVKKMFQAVHKSNRLAMNMVASGVTGAAIHKKAADTLLEMGFKTGKLDGAVQGFIHGTGHGVGLDIHELPTVSPAGGMLKPGHVITIEPGLYYRKHGGVRLEDVMYVTKTGAERLTKFPTFLEIDRT